MVAFRPHLTMRMRAAGAHHGAAVLEDRHGIDLRQLSETRELLDPDIDDPPHGAPRHVAQGVIVRRGVADDAANSGFALGSQQRPRELTSRNVGAKSGKIIVEYEGRFIRGIDHAARGPQVAGAQETCGIMGRRSRIRDLRLPLPGPGGTMRGNQHPLIVERIVAAMDVPLQSPVAIHGRLAHEPTSTREAPSAVAHT